MCVRAHYQKPQFLDSLVSISNWFRIYITLIHRLSWACYYSRRCPISFLFAQSLLLSNFCLDRTVPAAGGGQRVFSFFGWFWVSVQVFMLLQCKLEGLTDATAGLKAERCPVQSGWAAWKQGLELCNCVCSVCEKQKHLSSFLFILTITSWWGLGLWAPAGVGGMTVWAAVTGWTSSQRNGTGMGRNLSGLGSEARAGSAPLVMLWKWMCLTCCRGWWWQLCPLICNAPFCFPHLGTKVSCVHFAQGAFPKLLCSAVACAGSSKGTVFS